MREYQDMVVIFVDLLGTKNNKKFDDKFFIHRLFHSEARTNEERNLNHVVYDRKVYSFSDCAYFFYYYKNGIDDSRKDNMNLLNIAMSNTANSLLRILSAGYLVRGGITFGKAYFDELGFFGPAVEKAYSLESGYADVPMLALDPELGKEFFAWEDSQTNMELVNLLMTDRPRMVERDSEKFFLNMFYQLEAFSPSLAMESQEIDIDTIKNVLFSVIARDKKKFKDTNHKDDKCNLIPRKKSTIYEKLEWFEKYLSTRHNRLKAPFKGYSSVVSGD